MGKIKRSLIKSFLNVNPGGSYDYALIGEGVTSGAINYNPQTSEENYIHEDNARVSIEAYAPTLPIEMTAYAGTDLFSYLDGLRKNRSVLDTVETDIINVWLYEDGVEGWVVPGGTTDIYKCEKQSVSIQIDSFGGDGGIATKINYTVNFVSDPKKGTAGFTQAGVLWYEDNTDGARLSDLEISIGLDSFSLSPEFDPDFTYYQTAATNVEYSVEATAEDATRTVNISFKATDTTTPVNQDTGTAQGVFTPVPGGTNELTITTWNGSKLGTYKARFIVPAA